ncbi:MAG: hypothetical protein ACHP6H_01845 [Legionellales bacterium]
MSFKKYLIATGCAFSLNAMAGMMGSAVDEHRPWSIIGSFGYTWYDHFYNGGPTEDTSAQSAIGDGQTAMGRFAIARDFGAFKRLRFGMELGIQNGNTARLDIPQVTIDAIGGLLPQVTVKPMLDLLATASWQPSARIPVFGLVKPGIAYRRLQVNDRVTFNDLSQVAFEIQAGLGVHISDRATLSVSYQGIFDGSTSYTINTTAFTGNISNIPAQNGVLLSLSYAV